MVVSYGMGVLDARRVPYLAAAAVAVLPQMLWIHSGAAIASVGQAGFSWVTWFNALLSVGVAVAATIIVPREAMRRLEQSRDSFDGELAVDLPPIESPSSNQLAHRL
jgi:hypothetical protein